MGLALNSFVLFAADGSSRDALSCVSQEAHAR
jgi:hypothetical protein